MVINIFSQSIFVFFSNLTQVITVLEIFDNFKNKKGKIYKYLKEKMVNLYSPLERM